MKSLYLIRFYLVGVFCWWAATGVVAQDADTVRYSLADTADASKLTLEAIELGNKWQLDEAINKLRKAKTIYSQVLGKDNEDVFKTTYSLAKFLINKGEYYQALQLHLEAGDIKLNANDQSDVLLSNLYNNTAVNYWFLGDYETALKYHRLSLNRRLQNPDLNKTTIALSYNNIANCLESLGNYNESLSFYEKALKIRLELFGEIHSDVATTYSDMGVIFMHKGDYEKAIKYYEYSLKIRKETLGEMHPHTAFSISNIGSGYYYLGEFLRAVEYYEKAHEIRLKTLGENHPEVGYTLGNLANCYAVMKEYNSSLEYAKESLNLRIMAVGVNHDDIANSYDKLGFIYENLDKLDSAILFSEKSLGIRLSIFQKKHPEIAYSYYKLASKHWKKKDFLLADSIFNESLTALNYFGVLDSVSSLPYLITILSSYANFFRDWNKEENLIRLLHQSYNYFYKALEAGEQQSKRISYSSKTTYLEEVQRTLCDATTTNYLLHTLTDSLHYLTESFDFAERSKAMLLYEAMQETNALAVSGIPDSLLQQEYDLRIDIAYHDKKRQEKLSESAAHTDSTVLTIGGKLFDLNRRYEALKSRFEANYPQYYKAKYDLSTISLAEVQNDLLQPGQSLLEYLVGDSNIYVFLVRRDTFYVHEIKHDFPLEQWVRDMTKDGIYGYSKQDNERKKETTANYTRSAYQLYEKLVAPVADWLTEQVVVVPDAVLGYLPFEALLTSQPPKGAEGRFSHYDFMLKKHQISYCYSATLLREMRQKQHRQTPTSEALAMAPFFRGDVSELVSRIDTTDFLALRDSLGALEASGEEVAVVAKLLDGTAHYGGQASLEKFKQEAGRHRILHLSTHGKADDRAGDYAYLAFGVPGDSAAFDKLYARDLYNYSLNADMVVLSACETGIGKLRRGEGIVSLARAFAYAGAKSIFTTLWQVSDAKTAELMRLFYKNLKKGMGKDAALRQAKLDFLKNNKGEASHPFYWAGMIGIGDMGALRE